MKDSRHIDKFRKMAEESQKYVQGKSTQEIEKLVIPSSFVHYLKIVLAHHQIERPYLWRRRAGLLI